MKMFRAKVGACLLLACSIHLLRADNLLTAIDKADVHQVRRLLEDGVLGRSNREYQTKVRQATDALVKRAQKATYQFVPNGSDLFRMGLGSSLLAMACSGVRKAYHRHQELGAWERDSDNHGMYSYLFRPQGISLPMLGFIGVTGIVGLKQFFKGWGRDNAQVYLEKAREIETLVAQHVGQE